MDMKLSLIIRLAVVFVITLFAGAAKAQVPTPSESNVATSIQIQLPSGDGSILVVPNLINKISHVSWALLLPRNSNVNSLSWNDVSFSLASDSLNPPIVGLVNKPGGNQFYIIYQDGTIALSTASQSGISAPAVLGRDTNYTQFAYSKLAGQNALYLLTADGNIDISRNGGQSWQMDSGGAPFNYFIDLAVDDFNNAYAFYAPGGTVEVYKQEGGSNTWAPINFPANQLPTSIFIDRQNRFFVSTYTRGVYCSKDTGNTWTRSTTTLNGARGGTFGDDAAGNIYLTANGGAQLWRSIDTGATWTEIDTQITELEVDSNYLDVINSISGDSVLTASTIYGVFVSTDEGNTWTATNAGLHETQFNGFFKSTSGRFVETSNNGMFYIDPQASSFTHVLPSGGYGYAGPILADTIGNIYTSTETGYISNTSSFYWKSGDNGTSWQADTAGLSQISGGGSFGVDEYGNQYMSGHGNFGVQLLYKKSAGSSTFAFDTAGLYIRSDFFYNIDAIASDDNGRLFIGGGGDASLLTCWSRPINGTEWAIDTAGLGGFASVTYFTHESNHNMIAITGSGLFYHQSGTWNSIPLPAVASGSISINAVAADNSGGIIASFTYTSPSFLNSSGYGIYCTHDHGATWTEVGLKGVNVYGLHNFGDTTYALSDLGIFALTCSGIAGPLSIAETNRKLAGSLSLSPNPTSGICHAVFTLSSADTKNDLIILDITGRTIKTIPVADEANEVSFNTSDMNGGIYFCVLKSDEIVMEVKKLVVAK
jgi:photosystem II stability/assembly factor-like uncharacterized protein